jgi:hypothetical protein
MAGIGVFIQWLGYSLFFYGIDQVRGGNNGLLSLMIPGKFSEQPKDSAGPGPAAAATSGAPGTGGGAVAGSANPSGVSIWNATSPPKGAPKGKYRVNQDGTIEVLSNGVWTVYTAPSGKPVVSM